MFYQLQKYALWVTSQIQKSSKFRVTFKKNFFIKVANIFSLRHIWNKLPDLSISEESA